MSVLLKFNVAACFVLFYEKLNKHPLLECIHSASKQTTDGDGQKCEPKSNSVWFCYSRITLF